MDFRYRPEDSEFRLRLRKWLQEMARAKAPEGLNIIGHNGLSLLWVDMGSPGARLRSLEQIFGESEFYGICFENVRVPIANPVADDALGRQIRFKDEPGQLLATASRQAA